MVAERAFELPFNSSYEGGPVVIPAHERQKTEIHRGTARIGRRRSVHYTVETPLEHVSSEIVEVNVNGYAAPESVYGPVRSASAQLGRIGVSLGLYQDLRWLGVPSLRDLRHSEEIRQEAVVATLDDIDRHFGTELHYHLNGHSTGGRTSTGVAEGAPERIKGVTYTHTAAVVEGQNTISYAKRLSDFAEDELVANWDVLKHYFNRPAVLGDLIWYNFGNVFLSGSEMMSISNADIRDRIVALRSLKKVKTAILDGEADRLTPNTSVEAELGPHVDHYRMHPHPMIGHLGPQVYPVEMAMEHHRIGELLHPGRVFTPREFSVVSLSSVRRGRRATVSAPGSGLAAAS